MRLLSCVHILHVCQKVQYICHIRPRPLCVLAYLQQADTLPLAPGHPLVTTLTAITINNRKTIDQQSGPLWTIYEHVLLTRASSHARCAMRMLSQRHERNIVPLRTHEQLA